MMNNPEEHLTWREMLGQLLKDKHEKLRLAQAINVQPITLMRWVKGLATPHRENIRLLLKAMRPQDILLLEPLLARDFASLVGADNRYKQIQNRVPSAFYAQVFNAYALTPPPMFRQIILDIVLQQALEHLDPERHGMAINISTFIRPLGDLKIRSMHRIGGHGTATWLRNPDHQTILQGAESLLGYAITRSCTTVISNRSDSTFFPVRWGEHEQSLVAVPIMRFGQLAGGLSAASAIPDYFVSGQLTVSILEEYARLAIFIFEESEFVNSEQIALGFMPDYASQAPYFQDFSKRVSQQFRQAQIYGTHYTLEQAQRQVWREIEEELLQAFLRTMNSQ